MSPEEAGLLGVLQGLSEFLPISSSGHLKLTEALLGYEHLDHYLLFDIVCHVGTLLAILLAYSTQLRSMQRGYLRDLFVATLPLFPCALLIKPIKEVMNSPEYLGYFFIGTAAILLIGERFAKRSSSEELEGSRGRHALMVGCAQTLALFPGVSRSGTTISALRMMGWEDSQAKQFAFLMAVPAILGSVVLESVSLLKGGAVTATVPLSAYLIGFATSFLSGYGVLLLFFRVIQLSWFRYFGYYCFTLGLLALYLLG